MTSVPAIMPEDHPQLVALKRAAVQKESDLLKINPIDEAREYRNAKRRLARALTKVSEFTEPAPTPEPIKKKRRVKRSSEWAKKKKAMKKKRGSDSLTDLTAVLAHETGIQDWRNERQWYGMAKELEGDESY